jgi:hypothetical protein
MQIRVLTVAVMLAACTSSQDVAESPSSAAASSTTVASSAAITTAARVGAPPRVPELIVAADGVESIRVAAFTYTWAPATSLTSLAADGAPQAEDFLAASSAAVNVSFDDPAWAVTDVSAVLATTDGSGGSVAVSADASGTVTLPTSSCLDLFVRATGPEYPQAGFGFRADSGAAPLCLPLPAS